MQAVDPWPLLRPESLILLAIAVGLWSWRRRRATRLLVLSCLALVSVAVLPLGDLLLSPLENRFPPHPPVDNVAGIIVLGGGANAGMSEQSGLPELNDAGDRYLAAVTLARRYPDAKVLFTGGSADLTGPGISEGPVALRIFTDLGIAPARIHIEAAARSTAENAAYLRNTWSSHGDGTWLLVTSASHMPRAMGTFCMAGWKGLVAWPVDYHAGSPGLGWSLAGGLRDLDTAAKEWLGLAAYYVTGRSTSLFPASCVASGKAAARTRDTAGTAK